MNIAMLLACIFASYKLIYLNSYTCMYGMYLWIYTLYVTVRYKKHILKNNLFPKYLKGIFCLDIIIGGYKFVRNPKDPNHFEWAKTLFK